MQTPPALGMASIHVESVGYQRLHVVNKFLSNIAGEKTNIFFLDVTSSFLLSNFLASWRHLWGLKDLPHLIIPVNYTLVTHRCLMSSGVFRN